MKHSAMLIAALPLGSLAALPASHNPASHSEPLLPKAERKERDRKNRKKAAAE